ncbi:MAG: hypothetical protein ACPHUD_02935, partial [Porticoccaceae bacterium]
PQPAFTGVFDGTTLVDGVYTFPSTAESWAGISNGNADMYPIVLDSDTSLSFKAAVPDGTTADVRFTFEYKPYPHADYSYATDPVTVTGATASTYEIIVPEQVGTYSSLIMYLDTRDVGVEVYDVELKAIQD